MSCCKSQTIHKGVPFCTSNRSPNACDGCCLTSGPNACAHCCCHPLTPFQMSIQECRDKIAKARLKLRLLSQLYRKRFDRPCDCSILAITKKKYLAKKKKLEDKIEHCLNHINALKEAKRAGYTTRSGHHKCGSCNSCACNCA